jgi:hypothetical protein
MQYIVIVFSNICTNQELLQEIAQLETLEIFLGLYEKDQILKGYASTVIS